jgi:hypothetical protein
MTGLMKSTLLGCVLVIPALACSGAGHSPKQEVSESQAVKLDLPPVPEFQTPQPYSDGSHSVTEMRLFGAKYFDQPVKVTGFVVFQYDLSTCARQQGDKKILEDPKLCEGKRDIVECAQKVGQKIVENEPDLCERPYFYLGDTTSATFERSLWVTDVPRPLRPDERQDQELARQLRENPPPTLKVGQKVIVDGTWATKSPLGFANSEGLLVYAKVKPAE